MKDKELIQIGVGGIPTIGAPMGGGTGSGGGGGTGAVDSVNGKTGVVVLDAEDVGAAPQSTTYTKTEVDAALGAKQNTLVSGTNIATINGSDITQGGNVTIVAEQGQTITIDATPTRGSNNAVSSGGVVKQFDTITAEKSYVEGKEITSRGTISNNVNTFICVKVPCKFNDSITWTYSTTSENIYICIFDTSDVNKDYFSANDTSGTRTITLSTSSKFANASYLIATFMNKEGYTPSIKINGVTVWEKLENGTLEVISQKVTALEESLSFDEFPETDSTKLVKSGGIAEFVDVKTKDVSIVEHLNIDETLTGSLPSGSSTVNIPFNFYEGIEYAITVSSNVSNTGYVRIDSPKQTSQKIIDLSTNSWTWTVVPESNKSKLSVYVREVSTTGTLTCRVVSTDYRCCGLNVAKKNLGRNLADATKIKSSYYITNETIVQGGNHNLTDWIPIKNGQTLVCNEKANAATYRINGLFAKYGDMIPLSTSTYTSANDSYSTITNNLGYDAFAVFTIPKNTEPMICEGTIPHVYIPYNEVGGYTEDMRDFSSWGLIGGMYPHEVADEIDILSKGTAVRFVQITDTHEDGAAKFAYDFVDASSADFLVHTGDIVVDTFANSFTNTLALALAHTKPAFMVMGNHDVYHAATTQAVFEKYIEPLNTHNGLTNNTKTYYSVDFSTAKLKCLFMNDYDGVESTTANMGIYTTGNMTDAQITWFISELKAALTNSYSVVIFIHQYPARIGNFTDDWTDGIGSEHTTNTEFIPIIVDAFMESKSFSTTNPITNTAFTDTFASKGRFAGYFCGHTHCEQFGSLVDYPNQRVTVMSRPNFEQTYDGVYRVPTVDLANYVRIDGKNHLVSIYRLGSQITKGAVERKSHQYKF